MAKYTTKRIKEVTYDVLKTMTLDTVVDYLGDNYDVVEEIETMVCAKVVELLPRETMLNLLADEYGYHEADRLLRGEK